MKISLARAAAVLAVLTMFLPGCDSTPPPKAPAKPVAGIFIYDESDVYISLVSRSLRERLTGVMEHHLFAAGNDQFTQDEQISAFIARKGSILIVNMVDTLSASRIVDKAQKADIPVIFFNREPDLNGIRNYSKACFIGTTALDAGKMQGAIIKRLWDAHPEYDRNKDGKLQYIMIQANADNPEAVARTEYSVKRARELGVPLQQVGDTAFCDWKEDLAYESTRPTLAAFGNVVEMVIANNDSMALGAIRALNETGFNLENGPPDKFIPVLGVDAVPQAMEAIRKGVMSATVKQDHGLMAETIASFAANALNGKDFLDGTSWKWDNSGMAVRIPYAPYESGK